MPVRDLIPDLEYLNGESVSVHMPRVMEDVHSTEMKALEMEEELIFVFAC